MQKILITLENAGGGLDRQEIEVADVYEIEWHELEEHIGHWIFSAGDVLRITEVQS